MARKIKLTFWISTFFITLGVITTIVNGRILNQIKSFFEPDAQFSFNLPNVTFSDPIYRYSYKYEKTGIENFPETLYAGDKIFIYHKVKYPETEFNKKLTVELVDSSKRIAVPLTLDQGTEGHVIRIPDVEKGSKFILSLSLYDYSNQQSRKIASIKTREFNILTPESPVVNVRLESNKREFTISEGMVLSWTTNQGPYQPMEIIIVSEDCFKNKCYLSGEADSIVNYEKYNNFLNEYKILECVLAGEGHKETNFGYKGKFSESVNYRIGIRINNQYFFDDSSVTVIDEITKEEINYRKYKEEVRKIFDVSSKFPYLQNEKIGPWTLIGASAANYDAQSHGLRDFIAYFEGEVVVSGKFTYDEMFGSICFNVSEDSKASIPRLLDDDRYPWFCFNNLTPPLARELFVRSRSNKMATILITDYELISAPKEVSDIAKLIKIID
jgi:hypothetical protein